MKDVPRRGFLQVMVIVVIIIDLVLIHDITFSPSCQSLPIGTAYLYYGTPQIPFNQINLRKEPRILLRIYCFGTNSKIHCFKTHCPCQRLKVFRHLALNCISEKFSRFKK